MFYIMSYIIVHHTATTKNTTDIETVCEMLDTGQFDICYNNDRQTKAHRGVARASE